MLKNFTLGCLAFILCGCTFKTYKYYDPPAVYEVRTYNHSHRTYHKHYVKKKRKVLRRHKHFIRGKSGFYIHAH